MTPLILVYSEIADALLRAGISLGSAKLYYVASTAGTHAGWVPSTRELYVFQEHARNEAVVRDFLIHEVVHALITERYGVEETLRIDHGVEYRDTATEVAAALGIPSPSARDAAAWPMGVRPPGFYGPHTTVRAL